MLRAMFITVLMFVAGPSALAGDMFLIQFNSSDYDQNRTTLQALEGKGVVTRHIFPPQYAIIDALGLPERALTADNSQFQVFSALDVAGRTKLPQDSRIAEMFRHLVDPSRSRAIPTDNPGFIGCIEYEDLGKNTDGENSKPVDSSVRSTYPETEPTKTTRWNRINGQYMIGYIAVGIYLMESVGS